MRQASEQAFDIDIIQYPFHKTQLAEVRNVLTWTTGVSALVKDCACITCMCATHMASVRHWLSKAHGVLYEFSSSICAICSSHCCQQQAQALFDELVCIGTADHLIKLAPDSA